VNRGGCRADALAGTAPNRPAIAPNTSTSGPPEQHGDEAQQDEHGDDQQDDVQRLQASREPGGVGGRASELLDRAEPWVPRSSAGRAVIAMLISLPLACTAWKRAMV
jgi:hypothetical protein